MKYRKIITIMIIMIFFLAIRPNMGVANTNKIAATPQFEVTEWTTMVYNITYLNYNQTEDSMPMFDYSDGSDPNYLGNISEGNLFFYQSHEIPDISTGPSNISLSQRGVLNNGSWPLEYEVPITADPSWYESQLIYPVIPVWPAADAEWTELGANFTSMDSDFTVLANNDTHFGLSYTNSSGTPYPITAVQTVWSKTTGIMEYIMLDSEMGPENEPLTVEMDFLYLRDESQWDMEFEVTSGDLIAWNITTLSYDGAPTMPITDDDDKEEVNITESEPLIAHVDAVWDNSMMDHSPPHWNGSMMTSTGSSYGQMFIELSLTEPFTFVVPILVTGNDHLYGNITDEYASAGVDIVKTASQLQMTYDTEEAYVTVAWALDTGLLQYAYYDGPGPDNKPLTMELDLLYYMQNNELAWNHPTDAWLAYSANQIKNGTENSLQFDEDFYIHEGDIVGTELFTDAEMRYCNFTLATGRGYNTDGYVELLPPGLENIEMGPPAFYLAIPTGDENYWSNVTAAYDAVGYITINNATHIGFEADVAEFYAKVLWQKDTGLLVYYYVEAAPEGNEVIMELEYVSMLDNSANWYWALPEDIYVRYQATEMLNGTNDYLDFGEDEAGNELTIFDGDLLTVQNFDLSTMGINYTADLMTNSGYGMQMDLEALPYYPGFEFLDVYTDALEGPPYFSFVTPVTDQTAEYDAVALIWEAYGYNVTNTPEVLGFEGEKAGFRIEFEFDKHYGLLNHYRVETTMDGTPVAMELNRGVTVVLSNLEMSWNIVAGDTYEYHFSHINVDGENRLEFGENDYIYEDETIYITLDYLSSSIEDGPSMNISIQSTYSFEQNMFIGIEEPGFEFTSGMSEEGAPPLLYPALPLINGSYDLWADMWSECGYTVVNNATTLTISHTFDADNYFEVSWAKDTGLLHYYNMSMAEVGASPFQMVLVPGAGTYVPPEPSTSSTTATSTSSSSSSSEESSIPEFSPGFELFFALFATVTVVVYRKRKQ